MGRCAPARPRWLRCGKRMQRDICGQDGADPNVSGFGRMAGDQDTGVFEIATIKPGSIGADHAPHLTLWIVARGINTGLHTRMYFADEPLNVGDPVLQAAGGGRKPWSHIAMMQVNLSLISPTRTHRNRIFGCVRINHGPLYYLRCNHGIGAYAAGQPRRANHYFRTGRKHARSL